MTKDKINKLISENKRLREENRRLRELDKNNLESMFGVNGLSDDEIKRRIAMRFEK